MSPPSRHSPSNFQSRNPSRPLRPAIDLPIALPLSSLTRCLLPRSLPNRLAGSRCPRLRLHAHVAKRSTLPLMCVHRCWQTNHQRFVHRSGRQPPPESETENSDVFVQTRAGRCRATSCDSLPRLSASFVRDLSASLGPGRSKKGGVGAETHAVKIGEPSPRSIIRSHDSTAVPVVWPCGSEGCQSRRSKCA